MTTAKDNLRTAAAGANYEFTDKYDPKPFISNPSYTAPGRIGNPKLELQDEPRFNDKLKAVALGFGMGKHQIAPGATALSENSTLEAMAKMIGEFEDGLLVMYNNIPLDVPEDATEVQVEMKEETIKGGDGQDMLIYIYRPVGQDGVLPGVIYTHGGGMTIGPTMNRVHDRWARSLAAQGCVVGMTDFRNAYTKTGWNFFPKGLNDCVAGTRWFIDNLKTLRAKNVVLTGESGGGNLACAVALKANRDGWAKDIAGVYAIVPYISNAYGWPEDRLLKELPSLVECNGFFLDRHTSAFMAYFYTPNEKDSTDPLAWPYHATLEDMKGLPPHVLVMDELDMLRDEGVSYARRLVKAGVDAKGSINLGVLHGSSLIFRNSVKAFNQDAVRGIAGFARDLPPK